MSEPTWVVVQDDTFQLADTSTGSAGSTTAVSNQWVDVQGGVWQIAGDALKGTSDTVDATRRKRDFLLRPTNETPQDQQSIDLFIRNSWRRARGFVAIAEIPAERRSPPPALPLRDPPGRCAHEYLRDRGRREGDLAPTAATVSLTAGHGYRLDARAWGCRAANLALDLYDLAGPTDLATLGPIADSTAGSASRRASSAIVLNSTATSTVVTLSEVSCSIAGYAGRARRTRTLSSTPARGPTARARCSAE